MIAGCYKFAKMPHPEKELFIKDNKFCFGCIEAGHRSSDCKKTATCNKCSKKHPSSMHLDQLMRKQTQQPTTTENNLQMTTSTNLATDNSLTSNDTTQQRVTTMILQVWLFTTHDPSAEILVYALIDTQSDTSFIVDSIASQFTRGEPAQLLNATMISHQATIKSERFTNLQIRGFNCKELILISETFSSESIPVNATDIHTQETVKCWSHLKHLESEL